jgi:hydroxymethylpyrimidine pyrophosphatase-like HAD family hydrolase
VTVLYVDIDGTLVGPGGDLFWGGSTRVAEALLRARRADLTVVPVSGRGRVQLFELCRLLGLTRGVAELGCIHVGPRHEVRYELGDFPFVGETPVEAMVARGAVQVLLDAGLEPHDPWNEGREATYLLRGSIDVDAADTALKEAGFDWCRLQDNGALARRPDGEVHAYHLAPAGTGKAFGVRVDRLHHGLDREETVYVGDSASDLECAAEVGSCWLVANADGDLDWPHRTGGAYGDGVADVIDGLLAPVQ